MKRFLTLSIIVLLATAAWSTKTAQAIWTEGNTTLTFTYEEPVSVGGTYGGQTVSAVWSGTAVTATGTNNPGWIDTVKGSLTAVVFKQSFQSVKPTSCSGWFYGCTRLNNIQGITYLTTTNVTDMRYMFEGCSSLTSLNLSSFNTTNVTDMYGMFVNCSSLNSLDISSFNTAKVTEMRDMFKGCRSLTSLDLSSFNTANVKRFGYLFSGCSKLTNLIFPSLDTTNRNELWNHDYHYMFENCSSLKNLELSQCNIPNEFYFDGIPDQCFVYMPAGVSEDIKSQRSKNLVLKSGSSWTCANCIVATETDYDFCYPFTATTLTTDGTSASTYYRYSNGALKATLKTRNNVSIPKGLSLFSEYNAQAIWTAGNTTLTFTSGQNVAVGGTFGGQTVTNMWVGSNVAATGTNYPGWKDTVKGSLTTVVFKSAFKNVKPTSCRSWFDNCEKLTTITGISNLTTTNVTDMNFMFYGCSSLESLDLSSFITTNVTSMYWMFNGCSSLTSLNLSSFNTAKVTNMGRMFNDCSSLTSLNLSSFNTAKVIIMREMFRYCTSLKNLDLSSFNTSSVNASEYMFSSVPAQCFVYMPTGVINNIKNQRSKNLVLNDGSNWTCANCVLADGETLTLPYGFKALDGVTYERNIAANNGNGYTVFLPYDCPIPEGVTAYTLRTDEQSLLGEDKIVFAPIEGDVLEAYNPYLLVNSGEDLTNLNTTVDTQVLPTTTATAEKTFGDMRFTGTMRTISNEEAAEMGAYIMQTGCRWKKVMTTSPSAYIPAYRAYLISPSGEAQTRATLFDGTTVGIDPVAASGKLPAGDDNIYDLQGRCVATKGQWSVANGQLSIATGKLPKGVYITNGHRYVVK